MPTLLTHALAGFTGKDIALPREHNWRLWAACGLCSILPDLDVLAFRFGLPYGSVLGHRGFSHSLLFAAIAACAVAFVLTRSGYRARPWFWRLSLLLFIVTASHGLLDAMTDGGLGTAFFSPFDRTRYFLPFRPITAAPISVFRFFTPAGFNVLLSEILWIWIPCAALLVLAHLVRRRRTPHQG